MQRQVYNLGHLSHTCGQIGRLQTLSVIPVEAGASIQLSVDGIARLAPTRKEIVSECQADLMAFFVPLRHTYGQAFVNWLKAGRNTVEPAFAGIAVPDGSRTAPYLGLNTFGSEINRALVNGYNRIFTNFFMVPSYPFDSQGIDGTQYDYFPTGSAQAEVNTRKYGRLCARLPHVLNGGNTVTTGSTGWEQQDIDLTVDPMVPTGLSEFSILDLAQIQGRYNSLLSNAWFNHKYADLLEQTWGGSTTKDADLLFLQPEMLMRETRMMSGRDVDGTDDATLGTFQGKTLERLGMSMPRKFFGEHGNLYIMALLRYPLVHNREAHPLHTTPNPSYAELAANPEFVANTPPINFDPRPWLAGGATYVPDEEVMQPFGQQHRFQPNRVHENFLIIPGYPFSNWNGGSVRDWYYYRDNEYGETFQTSQIGQWQLSAEINCMKYSPVPGVKSSIFTGT